MFRHWELCGLVSIGHLWRWFLIGGLLLGRILLLTAAWWSISSWWGSLFLNFDLYLRLRPIALCCWVPHTILALGHTLLRRCRAPLLLWWWRGHITGILWNPACNVELLAWRWKFIKLLLRELLWTLSPHLLRLGRRILTWLVNPIILRWLPLRLSLWLIYCLRVRWHRLDLTGGRLLASWGCFLLCWASFCSGLAGAILNWIFLMAGLSLLRCCWLLKWWFIAYVLFHSICYFVRMFLLILSYLWRIPLGFALIILSRSSFWQFIRSITRGSLLIPVWLPWVGVVLRGCVVSTRALLYFWGCKLL
jgi:hypothetical protein